MINILFLGSILFVVAFVGCQATTPEISRPNLSTISATRITAIPTAISSLTPTPTLVTPTNAPSPTDTAVPSPTPVPTDTPIPTRSPWLIDQSMPFFFSETLQEVFIAYPDGRYKIITRGELIVNGQSWSPDGHQFIFWTNPSGPGKNVFVADLRDGSIQLLEFLNDSRYIFWSPDGKHLLYVEDGANNDIKLMLYEFETANSTMLVTIPRRNTNVKFRIANWSPDSLKIAYVAEIEEQFDLFTIDIETMAIQQLTDDPEAEVYVAWSPIENKILVATSSNNFNEQTFPYRAQRLYLLDESGTRQFLAEFEELNQVSWSPDGLQMATVNSGQICLLTLETLRQTCPLEDVLPADEFGAAFSFPPAWSPDSQWLAFQAVRRGGLPCITFYIFNLFTNELVSLDIDSCLITDIQWSPVVPQS